MSLAYTGAMGRGRSSSSGSSVRHCVTEWDEDDDENVISEPHFPPVA